LSDIPKNPWRIRSPLPPEGGTEDEASITLFKSDFVDNIDIKI
jgi:hypothetical protein